MGGVSFSTLMSAILCNWCHMPWRKCFQVYVDSMMVMHPKLRFATSADYHMTMLNDNFYRRRTGENLDNLPPDERRRREEQRALRVSTKRSMKKHTWIRMLVTFKKKTTVPLALGRIWQGLSLLGVGILCQSIGSQISCHSIGSKKIQTTQFSRFIKNWALSLCGSSVSANAILIWQTSLIDFR